MKKSSITVYKEMLQVIQKRSTCVRLQVGALLVKNDRIISTGWNGVPAKHVHCCDVFTDYDQAKHDELHRDFSNKNEIHAECNCIGYAAKAGVSTEGSVMFVSISPCTACAKLIVASGITHVYYIEKYNRETEGIDLLIKSGIPVEQM